MEDLRNFSAARRIVIKIGTNTLARDDRARLSEGPALREGIDVEYLHRLGAQVADLVRSGRELIIVTSGAIGMGAKELGLSKRVSDIEMRQACASIGQPLLMNEYHRAFGVYGLTVAQILLTRESFDNRNSYLNLRAALDKLLAMRIVPIINENDTISTAEIGNAFGDNDQLSASVASKVDADLLILLSDVDRLYSADPRKNPDAVPLSYVAELNEEIRASAGERGTEFSTGGMKTKIAAVSIARDAGCRVLLAHGREPEVLKRLVGGEDLGTLFESADPLSSRTRWLKLAGAQGELEVDQGALSAMRARKSLLPAGIVNVKGNFDAGSVVGVNNCAKLVSTFSSHQLEMIRGKRSEEAARLLGLPDGGGSPSNVVVARPEDTVFLDT